MEYTLKDLTNDAIAATHITSRANGDWISMYFADQSNIVMRWRDVQYAVKFNLVAGETKFHTVRNDLGPVSFSYDEAIAAINAAVK